MREARLEVEQPPRRLSLDEGRDDVDRGFQSCDADDSGHRFVHRRGEATAFALSQRIDEVFFGHEVAVDGGPRHPGQGRHVRQRQLAGACPEQQPLGRVQDSIGQISMI